MNNKISLDVEVNNIDEATKKIEHIIELLKEVQRLVDSVIMSNLEVCICDNTKQKEGYEIIIRDHDGKKLLCQTYPLDSIIGIFKNTYPEALDGWCHSDLAFSNLTTDELKKVFQSIKDKEEVDNESSISR